MKLIFLPILVLVCASIQYQLPNVHAQASRQRLLSERDNGQDGNPNRIAVMEESPQETPINQVGAIGTAFLDDRCGPGHRKCEASLCCSPAGTFDDCLSTANLPCLMTYPLISRLLWHNSGALQFTRLSNRLWHL